MSKLQYTSTLKSLPFFYKESVKAAGLLLQGLTAAEIKDLSLTENIFQVKSEARKHEIASAVLKRLAVFDEFLLKKVVFGTGDIRKLLLIYAIMKTDKLFFEFMNEVYKDKLMIKAENLTAADFKIFFQRKSEQCEQIASWTSYTLAKLQQVYIRILAEAGLIKQVSAKYEVIRPCVAPEIMEHLRRVDSIYSNVLLGV